MPAEATLKITVDASQLPEVIEAFEKLGRVAKTARALLLNLYEFNGLEFGAGELMDALHDALDVIPEYKMPE